MKIDIPPQIPDWLKDEYVKWKTSPKRYETLYSVSYGILKKYLEMESQDEKSKGRPSKAQNANQDS